MHEMALTLTQAFAKLLPDQNVQENLSTSIITLQTSPSTVSSGIT